jgi:hypothetical protein
VGEIVILEERMVASVISMNMIIMAISLRNAFSTRKLIQQSIKLNENF